MWIWRILWNKFINFLEGLKKVKRLFFASLEIIFLRERLKKHSRRNLQNGWGIKKWRREKRHNICTTTTTAEHYHHTNICFMLRIFSFFLSLFHVGVSLTHPCTAASPGINSNHLFHALRQEFLFHLKSAFVSSVKNHPFWITFMCDVSGAFESFGE